MHECRLVFAETLSVFLAIIVAFQMLMIVALCVLRRRRGRRDHPIRRRAIGAAQAEGPVMTDSRNFAEAYQVLTQRGATHEEAVARAEKAGPVLKIQVTGAPRSGKSALLVLIERKLAEVGIVGAMRPD
jgi:hypothetical protein